MIQYSLGALAYFLLVTNASAITPSVGWEDSYSADGQCYCASTFDHDAGALVVETPAGLRTTLEICNAIGPGPGISNNPIYNDLQCGNGPPNNAGDEQICPGRVDIGEAGCSVIGPTWDLERYFPAPETVPSTPATDVTTAELSASDIPEPDSESVFYEATAFSSKDDRWVVVNALGIREQAESNDERPVSVKRYLEVQPDSKVDQADLVTTDNVWPSAGAGPQLQFDIPFDHAGRYQIYARTFSVSEYDEGVSVGFDGLWAEHDNFLDTCNIRNRWTWSNCDERTAVVLNIPTNGVHTIQFSALNDGVEIDQFALRLIESTGNAAEPDLANAVTVGGGLGFGAGALSLYPELLFLIIMFLLQLTRTYLITNASSPLELQNDSREKSLHS